MKTNVYQIVTDKIVSQLEKGIIPWRKPWTGASLEEGGAINYVTRKPYSLINQYLLGKEGEYLSFNQIKSLGGKIKKGAKGNFVVFFTMVENKKKENEENEEKTFHPLLRYYQVFHIDDTTGIESKIKEAKEDKTIQPIERAEIVVNEYVKRENLIFQNDKVSGRAYYSPTKDMVVVPKMSQYKHVEEYYSTTFHELTHSTLKKSRCDREAENKIVAFGSADYSREELVAEMGSAMLCMSTGIDNEKAFNNSVAYIQSWLRVLKNDNKMIVWAASRAEKAAKYILNIKQ